MAIADDFSINFGAKTVTWVGTTGTYTTEALFEYLSDLMDDLANLDDDVPMDSATPQAYSIINGWQFGATVFEHLTGGGITDTTNDDLWTNLVTLGDLVAGQQIYVVQDGTEITPWWGPGALDVLIRVKQGGSLIDSGRVAVFARDWGNTFDVAVADLSKGAQQPVAIVTSDDIYNSTAVATVDGWNDITVTFGAVSKDLNNGSGARSYDVVVNCGGRRLSQVYERLKAITRHNSGFTVDGAAGEVYRRADDTYLEIKAAPFGTFAGTSFFGARGVWIENYSALDAKNFQLTDASGATQAPPNVVPVVVSGLVAGDSVAVFRLDGDGGAIVKDEYAAAAGNDTGNGTLTVKTAIAGDVPSAGVVRIGPSDFYPYTARSGSTFTLSGTLTDDYAEDADVYVPLILTTASGATASTTLIYSTDIPVRVVVRRYAVGAAIKPFASPATVTSAGMGVTAIRTADPVAS
jgi:hypothetical protein